MYPFLFETNIFPRFGLHGVHTYLVKTVTENASFFLQSGDFSKRQLLIYVWTDLNRGFRLR